MRFRIRFSTRSCGHRGVRLEKNRGNMRLIVVGEGADGRSTVVEVKELFEGDSHGREVLWATHEAPPEIPVPRRNPEVGGVDVRNAGAEPGGSRWFLVSRPPGGETGMH